MRISLAGLAVPAALALGLGACGANAGAGTTTAAPTAAASVAQSSTATAATSTTAAASTASTAATSTTAATATTTGGNGGASVGGPAAQCVASGLSLTFLGGQGATGHGELGFALRNTGAACSTGGYPGIQFLDQAGAPLPTMPTHTTSDFFGQLPLRELTLAPGQSASFRLGVSHGGGDTSAGCATAYGLQVIAPNDTAALRVSIPNGASECGATTVSPVEPGDSAYQ
jgi:hypothetical protein